MASSSSTSRTWAYDVFPSFSGEDVRKSFLSHLLRELSCKSITTFIDHGIERSRSIAPALFSAIRESKIAIVVFSKNYASSTWCLNELVEIHKCYEESGQIVIPVFYEVDPSQVRKQTGEFGNLFEETCWGKTEDEKQRWIRALAELADIAGEVSRNWSNEAEMIETIASDVLNKVIIQSTDFGDFLGIEAHLEAMKSMVDLKSEEVRMIGIVGPSGIGKTTIARALFSQLSRKFQYQAFVTYKRTNRDDYCMKLCWEEKFLSEILCLRNIKINHLGTVKQRLNHRKVLIVLDDVDDIELLKTLVGETGWFGIGSRIIVITRDRHILKAHKINLVYEVEFPSKDLALQMFSRSAFGQNSPPDGFLYHAVEVVELSGNLPLGLNVMGSFLRERDEEEWMELMPRLRNDLDGEIEKTLRVGYDGLDGKDQIIFLYIACLLNGEGVSYISNLLGDGFNIGIKMLVEKSLIRITPARKTVEMHSLLQKLGREIVRAESMYNPGKRRFLVDAEDICNVFTDNMGTETVLGICFNASEIDKPLFMDENSFKGMSNLQLLKVYKGNSNEGRLYLPRGLIYLPRKLRLLEWDACPLNCLPCNFTAEYVVNLRMDDSKLEKLWQGTPQLGSLKYMSLACSINLKEIPDLSNATGLEKLHLGGCKSLVTLPSSIRNLKKLKVLMMRGCTELEVLPIDVNLEYIELLDLSKCSKLRSIPRIASCISMIFLGGTAIVVDEEDYFSIENSSKFKEIHWENCPLRYIPSNFHSEHLVELFLPDSKLEKLWEGVQSLGSLRKLNLSGAEKLKEFPDLSMATNLVYLELNRCKSLAMVPSSIRNLNKLKRLGMMECTGLEDLPTDVNLESLDSLDLTFCSRLRKFPQISTSISSLYLSYTGIEEVPSWIENMSGLTTLTMRDCKELKHISLNIFKLKNLEQVNFSNCKGVTSFSDASAMTRITGTIDYHLELPEKSLQAISSFYNPTACLKFHNCFNLVHAKQFILQSDFKWTVLPGGKVPTYFRHQASASSLMFPRSSLFEEYSRFKACIMLEPSTAPKHCSVNIELRWYLRGKTGVHRFSVVGVDSFEMDHLVLFHFGFHTKEVNDPTYELDHENVKFEFYCHDDACSCEEYSPDPRTEICPSSVQRIKGCGIKLLHASPHLNGSGSTRMVRQRLW